MNEFLSASICPTDPLIDPFLMSEKISYTMELCTATKVSSQPEHEQFLRLMHLYSSYT